MPHRADSVPLDFQRRFGRRWGHLTRPHVRALAWLLDAPDLLDSASPLWGGRIASLGPLGQADVAWLGQLDDDPAPLDAALGPRFYSRLGLYAEKLMAFYFEHAGVLEAHGLQVRANRNDTVGEFDFLLRSGAALHHWEFATKFYLLDGGTGAGPLHCLVGPNLADTLGLKMRKILDKQLALGQHPAAQVLLPQAVARAQALVKGWLFYPEGQTVVLDGIAADHNRGFWCTLGQAAGLAGERFVIMPRLSWLAPLKVAADTESFSRAELPAALASRFAAVPAPLLLAVVEEEGVWLNETARGFIVPDDWPQQAAARRLTGALP